MNDRWRTIDVIVTADPEISDLYQVEFRPRNRAKETTEELWRLETNMILFVEYRGHLQINSFTEATAPIAGFNHTDYELKAILAVGEYRSYNP